MGAQKESGETTEEPNVNCLLRPNLFEGLEEYLRGFCEAWQKDLETGGRKARDRFHREHSKQSYFQLFSRALEESGEEILQKSS